MNVIRATCLGLTLLVSFSIVETAWAGSPGFHFGHPGFTGVPPHAGNFHSGFRHFGGPFRDGYNLPGTAFYGSQAFGYGFGLGDYGLAGEEHLPHFALYPPVYYSFPVARTYGYSPFAYPGYVLTPELDAPGTPIEITNPYVPSETAPSKTPAEKSAPPERILPNPPEGATPGGKTRTRLKVGPIANPTAAVESNTPGDKVLVIVNPYVQQKPLVEVTTAGN